MRRLWAGRWWIVLLYLAGGLALGLADPLFRRGVQQLGGQPGLGTAAIVNVVLPVLAVVLAVASPRLGTAWLGAVGMTAGLIVGLAVMYTPPAALTVAGLLGAVPPVLVMACVGYGVIGTLAALVTRRLRG